MAKRDELTLDEALSDPLILAVARADGTDAETLRRKWQPVADRLGESRDRPSAPRDEEDPRRGAELRSDLRAWRGVIQDCLCAARGRAAGQGGRSLI